MARGESPDYADILRRWEDRKSSWIYPGILNMLISGGCDDQEMMRDAVRLLDRDGTWDGYTTYFNLGLNLAWMMETEGGFDQDSRLIIKRYLKSAINKWEGEVSAESHIMAYELLRNMDFENMDYYYSKVLEWQVKNMMAQRYFPSLLDVIGHIPGLPQEIKEMVSDFAERLTGIIELDE